jgi:hypothetical protein
MRGFLRRLLDWAHDRRCRAGRHAFIRRESTFDEFMLTPLYDYGSCAHCGAPMRRVRL